MSVPQLIGGLLVGALAGSLFNKTPSYSSGVSSSQIPMQSVNSVPQVPKPPSEEAPEEDNAAAQAMREAEEKERQAALARQKGGQTVFTSPLGVVGQANVNRKQLLGA